jgi:hypothetical protein
MLLAVKRSSLLKQACYTSLAETFFRQVRELKIQRKNAGSALFMVPKLPANKKKLLPKTVQAIGSIPSDDP